ncbi:MAG: hypothetical protein HQK49_14765 [Oligoflexia bacterium]|nr:hypothetical protein [Oligoflexia bacterium]
MLYNNSKNLTFVIYDEQRPTKCFEIKKGQIRLAIFLLPLLFLVLLLALLFTISYIRNVNYALKYQEPVILQKYQNERTATLNKQTELERTNKELESTNAILMSKIKAAKTSEVLLPFIRPTMGAKDMTSSGLLGIQNVDVKFSTDSNRATLLFNLTNPTGQKITGHIFVMLRTSSLFTIYPSEAMSIKNTLSTGMTNYDMGEHFSMSRLRPVNASFNLPLQRNAQYYFDVVIFSKSGDLIYKKMLGPHILKS